MWERPRAMGAAGAGAVILGIGGLRVVGRLRALARTGVSPERGEQPNESAARESLGEETVPTDAVELSRDFPPGNYTRENIPPPSAEMRAFLEQIKRDAAQIAKQRADTGAKSARHVQEGSFNPVDKGKAMIRPTDKGKAPTDLD